MRSRTIPPRGEFSQPVSIAWLWQLTQHSIVGVISASIGSAASIYILVAITGYLTFGNSVVGNIVSMCKSRFLRNLWPIDLTDMLSRCSVGCFNNCEGGYRCTGHFQYPPSGASVPGFSRCCPELAPQREFTYPDWQSRSAFVVREPITPSPAECTRRS